MGKHILRWCRGAFMASLASTRSTSARVHDGGTLGHSTNKSRTGRSSSAVERNNHSFTPFIYDASAGSAGAAASSAGSGLADTAEGGPSSLAAGSAVTSPVGAASGAAAGGARG